MTDGWKPGSCPLPACGMGSFGEQRFCCYQCSRACSVALAGLFYIVCPSLCGRLVHHSLLRVPRSAGSSLGEERSETCLPFCLPNFKPQFRARGHTRRALHFGQTEETIPQGMKRPWKRSMPACTTPGLKQMLR